MEPTNVAILHQAADHEESIREAFDRYFDGSTVSLRVATDPEGSRDLLKSAPVALTFGLSEEQVQAATAVEWVQALNAGVDSYPLDALRERGIALTNASGVHAEPIGQQVLGYVLIFERRIHEGIRQQRAGEWDPYEGGELGDETLGIVGTGAIGQRVAELGASMDMTVVGTKRDTSVELPAVDELYSPDRLDEVLDSADYLVLACPLTDETRGLVGKSELSRLDSDAVLVNVARGEVVDEDALIDALQSGGIRGAALDVFEEEPLPTDSPLRSMSNVVTTPHVAGSTPYYFDRAVELFADNLQRYADGGVDDLQNRVL